MIVAALVVRLCLAAGMGLGIDESYMVAAAHSFQLSYFDHPPISWWLELAIQRLTGLHGHFIVRLPFLALFVGTSGLMYGFTRRLFGAEAGAWAVVGLTISPVFSLAFGTWVLPDGPLDFFLLAAAWALARAVGAGEPARGAQAEPDFWPLAGLFFGLALDSKYNAILVLAGAFSFLLLDRQGRRALARPEPWLACVVALIVFAPVLFWNAVNRWASFGFQGGRAEGLGFYPLKPFAVWGGEALFVLPWLFVPMVWLLIRAFRRNAERRERFLAWLAVIPVLLFSAVAIWSHRKILYHWATPGYLFLFPLLGAWCARLAPAARRIAARTAAGTATVLAVAALFIAAQIGLNVFPGFNGLFPPGKSPELKAVDWTSFRTALERRGLYGKPGFAVATLRWIDAGKIGVALGPAMKVTVFGGDPHEFGITTPPASLVGDNVLIAVIDADPAAVEKRFRPLFRSITTEKPIVIRHDGQALLTVRLLLGHHLQYGPSHQHPSSGGARTPS